MGRGEDCGDGGSREDRGRGGGGGGVVVAVALDNSGVSGCLFGNLLEV